MKDTLIPILRAFLLFVPKSKRADLSQMIDRLEADLEPTAILARHRPGRPPSLLRVTLDDRTVFFVEGYADLARWVGLRPITLSQYISKGIIVQRPVWLDGYRRIAKIDRPTLTEGLMQIRAGCETVTLLESDMPEGPPGRAELTDVQIGMARQPKREFRRKD